MNSLNRHHCASSYQTCSFRDHFAELKGLGVDHLFGLSTQDPAYQREAAERLHLPFAILSDDQRRRATALDRHRERDKLDLNRRYVQECGP